MPRGASSTASRKPTNRKPGSTPRRSPTKLPSIEALAQQQQKAEEKRKNKKTIPYVELDPSGRAKCKHCGEAMEKGSVRAILGRGVYFGNQVRVAPITVHPKCVAGELEKDDCETEIAGLVDAMRANSGEFDSALFDKAVEEMGELPEPDEEPAEGQAIDLKPTDL